jgi:nicotinamide-nucleotide amidase
MPVLEGFRINMPTCEIIAIGTELLLGEIQDTNSRFLARFLKDYGIDLYRVTIVGDNIQRIATAIQESMKRSQIVITSGGLGPTVDDPTRNAVALALGVETEFRPELWEQIKARFIRFGRNATENNRTQAFIPKGAIPIENPVGTAPAFAFDSTDSVVISLPGVPRELEFLIENSVLPYLKNRFDLQGIIKIKVLHSSGVGESQVDEWVADLETIANPTVGLLAHPGQTDIRVTAKAGSKEEADRMILEVSNEIKRRLGENIFGEDSETLTEVVIKRLKARNWKIVMLEHGTQGKLKERLEKVADFSSLLHAEIFTGDRQNLAAETETLRIKYSADVSLDIMVEPDELYQNLTAHLRIPALNVDKSQKYSATPASQALWLSNLALDFVRRNIPEIKGKA